MTAVTVTAVRNNTTGPFKRKFYTLTVTDTYTLDTGLHLIQSVDTNDSGVTLESVSGGIITFSVTSGPLTGVLVTVTGQ